MFPTVGALYLIRFSQILVAIPAFRGDTRSAGYAVLGHGDGNDSTLEDRENEGRTVSCYEGGAEQVFETEILLHYSAGLLIPLAV